MNYQVWISDANLNGNLYLLWGFSDHLLLISYVKSLLSECPIAYSQRILAGYSTERKK